MQVCALDDLIIGDFRRLLKAQSKNYLKIITIRVLKMEISF